MKQKRTAEEVAALAVLKAVRDSRARAARQAKRVRRAWSDMLKALQITLSELPDGAQDRGLRIVTAITKDAAALAACEKALAKPPRGWDAVETSVKDEAPPREAAE